MAIKKVTETSIHPLDFASIQKGDTFTRETLERIVGIREKDDPRGYDLALLGLAGSIEKARPDLDVGREALCLHIRTDSETVEKTAWRLAKGRRDASRARKKIAGVNPEKLSELEQRAAEKLHMASSVRELQLREQQRKLNRDLRLLEDGPVKRLRE